MKIEKIEKYSKSETAFCSLSAQVPSNISSDEEYERVVYTTVKTVNQIILKCPTSFLQFSSELQGCRNDEFHF